jgi:ectoine hydroxylase-related dioxygenase (phytanoyl-CoA dioxygenase family)
VNLTETPATAFEQHRQQLSHYGYVIIENAISPESVAEAREALRSIEAEELPGGVANVLSNLPPERLGPVFEMLTHPAVMDLALHALGPGFKMIGECGRLWARPGTPAQLVHADMPVTGWWRTHQRPMPENLPCLQTIWALSDFTADNGATQMIPFTHNAPYFPDPGADYDSLLVPIEMPAGSVVVFPVRTWHRRGENRTDADRFGLTVPYCAQWLDPLTAGWSIMSTDVWNRLPAEIQAMNPHHRG